MEAKVALYAVIAVAVIALLADVFVLGDPAGITRLFATPTPSPTPTPIPETPTPVPLPLVARTELADANCSLCFNISMASEGIASNAARLGVRFGNTGRVDVNSTEGRRLIAAYNITKIPTLLVSGETSQAVKLLAAWNGSGTLEPDGTLVLREVYPPYIDLTNGSLEGNVTVIGILYEPCTSCYDVGFFPSALEVRYGVHVAKVMNYSFNTTEWNATVAKYNITKVPAVIISPELALYPGVEQIWVQELGTKEPDGWFVFRTMNVSGAIYYDLVSNTTVHRMS